MTRPDRLAVLYELQARYMLAAAHAEGRRILDVGGFSAAGLAQLTEAGAQTLTVAGDDLATLRGQLQASGLGQVILKQYNHGPLPCEPGAFDMVICHDVAERLAADPQFATQLRRALAADGWLWVAVANPNGRFLSEVAGQLPSSGGSYADLSATLLPHFGAVTVFGQSPLAGSLFFDFGDASEDTGLTLDRSFLPDDDEEPGWYVLLFGPQELHRDDLVMVQLPFATLLEGAARRDAGAAPAAQALDADPQNAEDGAAAVSQDDPESVQAQPSAISSADLEVAHRVLALLESERLAARAQAEAAEVALFNLQRQQAPALVARPVPEADPQLAHLRQQLAEAEEQLAHARQQLDGSEARLLQARQQEQDAQAHRTERSQFEHLQQELERSQHDKNSFETQIRDLLAEVAQLRQHDEERRLELQNLRAAHAAAHQHMLDVQAQLSASQEEGAAAAHKLDGFAELQAELAQLREQLQQRQTTAVAPKLDRAATAPAGEAAYVRDAVGRELDTAVEELEDLLKDVAPPLPPSR